MGKKLKDEDLVLNIIVNGDRGRSELNQLRRAVTDMNAELARLEAEQKRMTAANQQNTPSWRLNAEAIQRTRSAIEQTETRMKLLRQGMKLTDLSMQDLIKDQKRLTALMKTAVPGSENYVRYRNELKLVQNRLNELNGQVQQGSVSLGKMAGGVNRYIGLASAFVGSVTMGVMGLKKANQAYAEHDDKLADVMKTTGLTKDSVKELDDQFAKIDTRTAQMELLGLAQQAGKLGLSAKEDVEKFVVASDKIGVALGEDLGGTEDAINSMGKLVDLFQIKDQYGMGEGMLKVGSAVNALGAASTANEGYIVDFTSRVGGLAVSSKIVAADIMGLAATFDSLNAPAEASATVVNKVLVGMFSKTAQYAKVAKMDVKEFTTLLKTDANEALLRVMEGFKGKDLGVTAGLLGEVGENGARAAQAVALISENIEVVRSQQALANEEFEKGTGIIDEFNTKNNTAQAQLEKAQKVAQQRLVELGAIIQPLMKGAVSGFAMLIQGLTAAVKFLLEYKAVIIGVSAAMLVLVTLQKIKSQWDRAEITWGKLKVFWNKAERDTRLATARAMVAETIAKKADAALTTSYTLGQKALIAVKALLAGQFKATALAAKAFFASLGPVGWIIAGVTLLGGALGYLASRSNEATASQKALADINHKAALSIVSEKNEIERMLAVASSKEESDMRRLAAMEKLQELIPNGIELINQETIANGKAKISVDDYCKSLLLRAKLEAAKDYLKEFEQERLKAVQEGEAAKTSIWQDIGSLFVYAFAGEQAMFNNVAKQSIGNLREFESETKHTSESIVKQINDLEKQLDITPGAKPDITTPKGNSDGSGDNKQKWSLDNDEAFSKARIELKQKLFNQEIATEDEYNRQVLALEIKTLDERIKLGKEKGEELIKLQADLLEKQYTQQKQEQNRIKQLQEVADSGKSEAEQEQIRYDKRLAELKLFDKQRQTMTMLELAALVTLEEEHTRKLSAIHVNQLTKEFDASKKEMDRAITALKEKQAQELSEIKTYADKKQRLAQYYSTEELRQITNDKQADQALRAAYRKQEITEQQAFLNKSLALHQAMTAEFQTHGTVFGEVLTEEDAAKMAVIIDNLKKQLADLGVEIDKTPEGGQGKSYDLLGMTPHAWDTMFKNLADGKNSIDEWAMVVGAVGQAVGQAFSEVSNLMTSIEQRELKNYEKTQNNKKRLLEKQLKSGTISQEAYNKRVQSIDQQTDVKRQEMERKQAERQKMMAIFQILLNTAMAIMSTYAQSGWPGAIPFVAVIGALAAMQLAAVIAQPLPGAESGGLLVERTQDGRRFDAEFEPRKRGAISKPTVIVGENGTEYVVPSDGYDNPTVRPVLSLIESARRSGTLRQLNLQAAMTASYPGRAAGGYTASPQNTPAQSPTTTTAPADQSELQALLIKANQALDALNEKLPHLKAVVSMTGKNGIVAAQKKYNAITKEL